jgi:recombination protein RecA
VIEIYGPESSGKTTLALHAIAEAQKVGGTAAFVDAEHALDPGYAKKLGVDIDELIVSQPDTGEQALEIVDTLVRSNAIDVLVIDSVAALVPRAEIEGEMGDSHVGLQARLMSQALRKLTGSISRSRCTVIFINQVRMKIGVMYGNPETTTGGNALKFYASVRLDIRRTGQIKDRDDIVGNTTRVKVVKNKVAPPFKQVEFDIMYGEGVSKVGEILDLGVKAGLVEKSGAWFSYDSIRIGQGRENAKVYLKENPDVAQRIENAIRGKTEEVGEALMVGPDDDDDRRAAQSKPNAAKSPIRGRRRIRNQRIGRAGTPLSPQPRIPFGGRRRRASAGRDRREQRRLGEQHDAKPASRSSRECRSGTGAGVPSNDWPMAKPMSAPPIVPRRPGPTRRCRRSAPCCSIASVPRFDEVKAKRPSSALRTTNSHSGSRRQRAIAAWTAVTRRSRSAPYARPGAGRSGRRRGCWPSSPAPSARRSRRTPARSAAARRTRRTRSAGSRRCRRSARRKMRSAPACSRATAVARVAFARAPISAHRAAAKFGVQRLGQPGEDQPHQPAP